MNILSEGINSFNIVKDRPEMYVWNPLERPGVYGIEIASNPRNYPYRIMLASVEPFEMKSQADGGDKIRFLKGPIKTFQANAFLEVFVQDLDGFFPLGQGFFNDGRFQYGWSGDYNDMYTLKEYVDHCKINGSIDRWNDIFTNSDLPREALGKLEDMLAQKDPEKPKSMIRKIIENMMMPT